MNQYKIEQSIDKMNLLGHDLVPFLFFIDFEIENPQIIPCHKAEKQGIHFDINGFGNLILPKRNINRNLVFNKYPPSYSLFKSAYDIVLTNINFGNTYLINLTFPSRIELNLSLMEVFVQSQAKYKLFYQNEFVVFSPETFIRIQNGTISSYPMKGTIDASLDNAAELLLNDTKEKAEHATIVDLIRNDLSKVAIDIKVNKYRYFEIIKTQDKSLLQTSSEIIGKLPEDFGQQIGNIVFSLLPAGSISGAPKKKTLEIIKLAENGPRGYYTGVFGYFDGKQLDSAVMIRFIEKRNNQLWFRSGGGITAYSNPESEYQEMIDKIYVPIY